MDIKILLKLFVYIFIIYWFLMMIIILFFQYKEGFDEGAYISRNRSRHYTAAEAGAVDFGIVTAVTALSIALIALYVTQGITLAIPFIGWIIAIPTSALIVINIVAQAVLLGQWVVENDPKTLDDTNREIAAINEDIAEQEYLISTLDLSFNTLKYEFKGNQTNIKKESNYVLKYITDFIELIQEMYFKDLNNCDIPMIQLYNICKDVQIYLSIISNDHTLRKDLDIKSSDIDLTLLDSVCFEYYYSQETGERKIPPKSKDIKSDITSYLIIVTYRIGKKIKEILPLVNKHITEYPDNTRQRKRSISENNRKKLSSLFKKLKPRLERLDEFIDLLKKSIKDNLAIFQLRDQLRAIIAADKIIIARLEKYKIPHFFTK